MIEPTDEMREVAYALLPTTARGHVDIALASVLGLVERDRSDAPGLTRGANAARRIADRLNEQANGKDGVDRIEKLSQSIGARLVAIRLTELADAEEAP